jgi:hypothetical protein
MLRAIQDFGPNIAGRFFYKLVKTLHHRKNACSILKKKTYLCIQFNSFIFLLKQVKIKCQHNDKNYMDGEKGHTVLVNSSLKLIAGEIGKRRQLFWLLAVLKPLC